MSDHHHSDTLSHDTSDPHIKPIVLGVVMISFTIVISIAIGMGLYKSALSNELDDKENVSSTAQLDELHATEDQDLTSYKLIDKAKGIVEIPITVAMDRVVAAYQATQK